MNITLAVAVLPALGLIWLFRRWDKKRPEPPGMIRNAMIFGAISCIPAALIEILLMGVLGDRVVHAQGGFVNGVVVAAMTEEAMKLAVVLLFFYRRAEFNETMDGILYTAAASLGFALLENVLYAGGNLIVGLARAISAVPLHATCSGLMGYYIGAAKMRGNAGPRIALGYLIAVAIHGVYDWAVFSGGRYGFGPPEPLLGFGQAVLIVAVAAVFLRFAVKKALAEDDSLLGPHSRPLAPRVQHVPSYAWPPQHPHAPYGAPHASPPHAPPAPYGLHQPYAGHAPQPQGPPHGWHPQPQPYGPYAQQQPYGPYAQQHPPAPPHHQAHPAPPHHPAAPAPPHHPAAPAYGHQGAPPHGSGGPPRGWNGGSGG